MPFICYALAGVKLLPAFQQVYAIISTIQGNLSAFDSIREDFKNSQNEELLIEEKKSNYEKFKIEKTILLKDIIFSYPGKSNSTLNELNIEIPVNKTVGIVGSSGSGKSTIIDIILGLINPDKGEIVIDGEFKINKDNIHFMQDKIGFVPQSIFLSDASIKENIAFGESISEIDESKIEKSLILANLDEFITTLPDGLDTQVGQNGMQLSGGQRQRIGIARALYRESEILIFDEATSSLDNVTEALVMDAINNFAKTKTIIIVAHRLSTVQKCDKLYLIDKGNVVDSGNYEYLLENNKEFLEMATIIN
jgi:ABC-type bacteriocin/lantibiotic exporters, contain an N-terminal double-glycine peptidase domain